MGGRKEGRERGHVRLRGSSFSLVNSSTMDNGRKEETRPKVAMKRTPTGVDTGLCCREGLAFTWSMEIFFPESKNK